MAGRLKKTALSVKDMKGPAVTLLHAESSQNVLDRMFICERDRATSAEYNANHINGYKMMLSVTACRII